MPDFRHVLLEALAGCLMLFELTIVLKQLRTLKCPVFVRMSQLVKAVPGRSHNAAELCHIKSSIGIEHADSW